MNQCIDSVYFRKSMRPRQNWSVRKWRLTSWGFKLNLKYRGLWYAMFSFLPYRGLHPLCMSQPSADLARGTAPRRPWALGCGWRAEAETCHLRRNQEMEELALRRQALSTRAANRRRQACCTLIDPYSSNLLWPKSWISLLRYFFFEIFISDWLPFHLWFQMEEETVTAAGGARGGSRPSSGEQTKQEIEERFKCSHFIINFNHWQLV
jgi:hypothetical protein